MAWMRPRVALVEGETPSPLQRLLVVADSASGLAVVLDPDRSTFINADLIVTVPPAPARRSRGSGAPLGCAGRHRRLAAELPRRTALEVTFRRHVDHDPATGYVYR